MANLAATYLGIPLANPLIVGSSTHTATPEKVQALAAAGAGAVVVRSIFEEQIRAEMAETTDALEGSMHPEAYEYLRADVAMRLGPQAYLERVAAIKQAAGIPVIASINCTTAAEWVRFARQIEATGVDGLELNVYDIPESADVDGAAIEARHLALVAAIQREVRLPISVKLGSFYSSLPNFVVRLAALKIGGVVLFNRFFQPDVDIERLELRPSVNLSRPEDIRLPLRWIALLRDQVACDLCLSTGVHDGEGAVKALLAGADVFQICTVLYRQDPGCIGRILEGLRGWMNRHSVGTLAEARGRLSQARAGAGLGYERAQYIKTLTALD